MTDIDNNDYKWYYVIIYIKCFQKKKKVHDINFVSALVILVDPSLNLWI